MKRPTQIIAVVAVALALASAARAAAINGTIGFGGTVTLDTGSLATANAFTSFVDTSVSGTGDFAGITTGNFSAVGFTFDPFSPPETWWTLTLGDTFTFDLTSLIITQQTAGGLSMHGNGTAYRGVVDATDGTWSLNVFPGGGSFFFAASTNVPDAAATLLLLGTGLTALGLFGRFRKRVS
jgi:hypothetical protein